jgi:hypothetical protein
MFYAFSLFLGFGNAIRHAGTSFRKIKNHQGLQTSTAGSIRKAGPYNIFEAE